MIKPTEIATGEIEAIINTEDPASATSQDRSVAQGDRVTPPSVQPQPVPSTSSASKRKRRPPRRGPHTACKPRRQGDGDGLCGHYAVINGLRLALTPHGGLSRDHEGQIWRTLVRHADRKWRFASLFLDGMVPARFVALARRAAAAASKLTGIKVRFQHIPKAAVMGRRRRLVAVVNAFKVRGHVAILACIEGSYINHWSVILGLSASSLRLFDSGFHDRLKLRNCRLLTSPKPKVSPRYWVRLHGVFQTGEHLANEPARRRRASMTAGRKRKVKRGSRHG